MVSMLNASSFGAVGDGAADDTAALQSFLTATVVAGKQGCLEPGTYKVTSPLVAEPIANIGVPFGIVGRGAVIKSAITTGADVLTITAKTVVRYLTLDGFEVQGSGSEGSGLVLSCLGGVGDLYNVCLRGLKVEGCGAYGIKVYGNVFESAAYDCHAQDNKGSGLSFRNSSGGIVSAWHVFGGSYAQNGLHGVEHNADTGVGQPYDIGYHGVYFRTNQDYGLYAPNGCAGAWNCGFEDNWRSAPTQDFTKSQAGARIDNFGLLSGCSGAPGQKQTHLLQSYVVSSLTAIACRGFTGVHLATVSFENTASEAKFMGCSGILDRPVGTERQIIWL